MRQSKAIVLSILMLMTTPALAATAADFDNAYAAAMKLEKDALAQQCAWTVAETALANAKKAADAKDYDSAVAMAHDAESFAKASLDQARAQGAAWRDAVLR